jgi:urea carboxylase/allophanate hydrolase
MEVKINAPISGKCVKLLVEQGDIVGPTDNIAIIQGAET